MTQDTRDAIRITGATAILAGLMLALVLLTGCGGDEAAAPTAPELVPVISEECSMLRVAVRTYLGSERAEVSRWRVADEPLVTATPLNARGNVLPSGCGWTGSAAFELVTPGMECSMLGDPASSSRWLKCDRPGRGRIVGTVIVGTIGYSGSWDIEVL